MPRGKRGRKTGSRKTASPSAWSGRVRAYKNEDQELNNLKRNLSGMSTSGLKTVLGALQTLTPAPKDWIWFDGSQTEPTVHRAHFAYVIRTLEELVAKK